MRYRYAEEKSWHPLTVTRLIHAREDPIRSNSLNGRILDLFIRVMTPRGLHGVRPVQRVITVRGYGPRARILFYTSIHSTVALYSGTPDRDCYGGGGGDCY